MRKIIQELHPEVNVKPIYTLLVDGTNLLRICMEDEKVNTRGEHVGGIFLTLLKLKMLLTKKQYDYVYVFFDDEDSGILRYEIYPDYKGNRDKNYEEHVGISEYMKLFNETIRNRQKYIFEKRRKEKAEKESGDEERYYIEKFKLNVISEQAILSKFGEKQGKKIVNTAKKELVDENFARERERLCLYFNELFIRWQIDEKTEGDDLISYYVHNKKDEEYIVIVSGDADITQLISDKVCVYHPIEKIYYSTANFKKHKGYPIENVVLRKILLGDNSDNIGNIKGLSENRLMELMPEIAERPVTIEEVKKRAQEKCNERINEKKKPLVWQQNIVDGVCNGNYSSDFYETNRKLVDLSTPLLTEEAKEEIDAMRYMPQDPTDRTFENLYRLTLEDDIDEFKNTNSFANFFQPFKALANKEVARYEEFIRR